ncbi:MAG: histidine phosphatase family protein [Xenococcaceae cyanobacterium]
MKRFFIATITVFLLLGVKQANKFISFTYTPAFLDLVRAAELDIWTQMRENTGYVVLLRHAQTVSGIGDPSGFELDDCATQRNLSEAGREQAKQIGREFRERNIPITRVLSSQYCRCLDTAKLLNLGTVEPSPMLNSIFEDRTTATQQVEQTRQQIIDYRNTSGVMVMVTHFANITEISGASPQEGEAIVIKANPRGNLEVVGRIQDW